MHVIHCFVGLATLQSHQGVSELAFSSQSVVWAKFHIEKDEDFFEVLLCFVVVDWLNVLDLVVYHWV